MRVQLKSPALSQWTMSFIKFVEQKSTQFEDNSFDLITVAQALHWFNFEKFFQEAKRVAKNNALLAVWSYDLCKIESEIDEAVFHYYSEILKNYWPPERKWVDEKYQTIPFPF